MRNIKSIKTQQVAIIAALVFLLFGMRGYAYSEKEIVKTYPVKQAIQLNTIDGSCTVKAYKGEEIKVRFTHSYSNTTFEPQFLEEGDTLVLKEKFHVSGSGESSWELEVPENTEIKFATISGDFSITGLNGKLEATSVSGTVTAKNCSGELELKSANGGLEMENLSGNLIVSGSDSDMSIENATGNIEIRTHNGDLEAEKLEGSIMVKSPSGDVTLNDCKGRFDIRTASGDIEAFNILIEKKSMFKAASGDIEITLAKNTAHDLVLDTASGNILLNYKGNPIEGYFEFKSTAVNSDFISPYPFEKEEETEVWGKKFVVKGFQRVFNEPKICLYTSSGKVELKEK